MGDERTHARGREAEKRGGGGISTARLRLSEAYLGENRVVAVAAAGVPAVIALRELLVCWRNKKGSQWTAALSCKIRMGGRGRGGDMYAFRLRQQVLLIYAVRRSNRSGKTAYVDMNASWPLLFFGRGGFSVSVLLSTLTLSV